MSQLKSPEGRAFIHFLLETTSEKQAEQLLRLLTHQQALAVGEIFLNVLQGTVKLPPAQRPKFKRHRALMRTVSNPCTAQITRQRLIKSYAPTVLHLLKVVEPTLRKALSSE